MASEERPVRRGPTYRLAELVATGFGSGRGPIAPATWGSAAALVLYYLLPVEPDSVWFYALIAAAALIGAGVAEVVSTAADPDPGRVVIDEWAGMWVTLLFLPKTAPWLAAGFFAFRVLDVLKPWPARRLESLHGGVGIMADDIAAGLYGALLLNAARLLFFNG